MHELALYKNRKFRSRKEKRYLTLDEIAESVKSGDTVTITQHDTGLDVTEEYLRNCVKYLDLTIDDIHELIRKYPLNAAVRERRSAQVEKEKLATESKKKKVAHA